MKSRRSDPKQQALLSQGTLNPHPEEVRDPLFGADPFFDPRDLLQVKYEMVRRVQVEGQTVTAATQAFGLSRPTFYQTQQILAQQGLVGLLPKKRGPRTGHKLDAPIVSFLQEQRTAESSLSATVLAERVRLRFGKAVHPRSIERALVRAKKKPPQADS